MPQNKRILAEDREKIKHKIRKAKTLLAKSCFYSKRSLEVTIFILEEWLEDIEEQLEY